MSNNQYQSFTYLPRPLPFYFCLKFVITKNQENQKGVELNGIHHFMVNTD